MKSLDGYSNSLPRDYTLTNVIALGLGPDVSQFALLSETFPDFSSVKQLRVFLLPNWMGCKSISGLPSALHSPVPIYTPGLQSVDSAIPQINRYPVDK